MSMAVTTSPYAPLSPLKLRVGSGSPSPLGTITVDKGTNFAVVSRTAVSVTLNLYDPQGFEQISSISLDPKQHRTGDVWHVHVDDLQLPVGYSYNITHEDGRAFHELLDPYAREVLPRRVGRAQAYRPLGAVLAPDAFDWQGDKPLCRPIEDAVIYEMHVGGFTRDPSSGVSHPGSFLGVIEKIPYLRDLGVNTVELLPVFDFDLLEGRRCCVATREELGNYWGYSTINFFAPAHHYVVHRDIGAATQEFKQMVQALHQAGIEVILDVVYNHTAEGDHRGVPLSFKGFAHDQYYLVDDEGRHLNFSGCGNTVRANHALTQQLILDSLRHWVVDMHVDGFRFDLASALARNSKGHLQSSSAILDAIAEDPVLASTKLIAEPWDAAGAYQVGNFCPNSTRWTEWNGRYRDALRRFIRGESEAKGEFATRLCGSADLYGDAGSPANSLNFVTSHDGFSLEDLVSYDHKHNDANGEGSRDGCNHSMSWNCGYEGATDDSEILTLRARQKRNFMLALLVSRGVPMLTMGDERSHTKKGNNNTWCQDAPSNWLNWSEESEDQAFLRFTKCLISLRREHPIFQSNTFCSKQDVTWHGLVPNKPDWESKHPYTALTLHDETTKRAFYLVFNADNTDRTFTLPDTPHNKAWHWVVNTSQTPPHDFSHAQERSSLNTPHITLMAHSSILLIT